MAFYHRLAGMAVLASATLLTGCGAFFSCEGKSDCPVTTTPTATTDFVFVSNGTSGTSYITGYDLTNGTLTAISGDNFDLGFVPIAMSVAPGNKFLYVASRADATGSGGPGVFVYSISSTGVLSKANNGTALFTDSTISSMVVSPDGNFLFTVTTSGLGVLLNQYELVSSTGLLATGGPDQPLTAGTSCATVTTARPVSQQCTVAVSPDSTYVAVALGGYGFEVFDYTSSGGLTGTTQLSPSPSSGSADFSLAFDNSDNVYVASTSALTPFTGLGGTSAPIAGTAQTYGAQVTPRAVTLTTNYEFLYTANEGSSGNSISEFSVASAGTLTSLGSAIVGPASVSALGADNTGKYLVAAGYNATNGVQLFNITSSGMLTATTSVAGTGTDLTVPTLIAISH